jgi:hypothetical protein
MGDGPGRREEKDGTRTFALDARVTERFNYTKIIE